MFWGHLLGSKITHFDIEFLFHKCNVNILKNFITVVIKFVFFLNILLEYSWFTTLG